MTGRSTRVTRPPHSLAHSLARGSRVISAARANCVVLVARASRVISRARATCVIPFAVALLTGSAAGLAAQSGNGSSGGAVLTLPGGSRAAAMGGAYVATRDVDALFYNPASAAWLGTTASMAMQRHVEDMTYASLAATVMVRRLGIGLTVGYLDFGSIDEVTPDPAFGGQRGQLTGGTVDAGEGVVRLVAATSLGSRLAIGAAAGLMYASLVETGRPAALFDAGLHYRLSASLTAGAALRQAGADVTGARLADAPLPTELRAGLAHAGVALPADALARFDVELLHNIDAEFTSLAAGLEIERTVAMGAAASLRAGYDGSAGPHAIGRLHVGAGLVVGRFALDYALQPLAALGTAHRFGIRWMPRDR